MQARPRNYQLVLVLIITSMLLGACGGSGSGSTWFNLPSVPVKIQADGSAKVFGFSLGPVLNADQVSQLQAANIQQLNIRVGYNGVHPYANGEDLPYLTWDDASFATMQEILPKVPNLPNAGTISTGLTWARRIGLGAALNLPVGAGQTALDIPRWKGETTFTPETPDATTIGPFDVSGLAIDSSGSISLDGMPLSQLESALGMSFGLDGILSPDLLNTLNTIGAETISIATNPNGIDLGMNGKPLPGLAYDSASLSRTMALVEPFVSDPALVAQIKDLLPKLPGADVRIVAALNGPAVGKTALGKLPFTLNEQGQLGLYGFNLLTLVPPAMVQQLQEANLQQLDAKVVGVDQILLAANGATLPTVALNDATVPAVSQLVGSLVGWQPTLLSTIVDLLKDTGVSASLNLPLAAGAEAVAVGDPFADGIQAPNLGDFAPPVLHMNVSFDKSNKLKSVGPLTGQELQEQMGVGVDLPGSITSVLSQVGANQVQAINTPGQFALLLNQESAVALQYDVDSLVEVLRLLAPFMKGTIMEDPGINGLIQQQILPLVPGSDVNFNLMLNQ